MRQVDIPAQLTDPPISLPAAADSRAPWRAGKQRDPRRAQCPLQPAEEASCDKGNQGGSKP